jgi:hypothetical protein
MKKTSEEIRLDIRIEQAAQQLASLGGYQRAQIPLRWRVLAWARRLRSRLVNAVAEGGLSLRTLRRIALRSLPSYQRGWNDALDELRAQYKTSWWIHRLYFPQESTACTKIEQVRESR